MVLSLLWIEHCTTRLEHTGSDSDVLRMKHTLTSHLRQLLQLLHSEDHPRQHPWSSSDTLLFSSSKPLVLSAHDRLLCFGGVQVLIRLLLSLRPRSGWRLASDNRLQIANACLEILRETVLCVYSAARDIGSLKQALMPDLFALMRRQETFSNASHMVEVCLEAQPGVVSLARLPRLRPFVAALGPFQLAFFARILAVTVFDQDDINDSSRCLADAKRGVTHVRSHARMRAAAAIEANHRLIFEQQDLLFRLVDLVQVPPRMPEPLTSLIPLWAPGVVVAANDRARNTAIPRESSDAAAAATAAAAAAAATYLSNPLTEQESQGVRNHSIHGLLDWFMHGIAPPGHVTDASTTPRSMDLDAAILRMEALSDGDDGGRSGSSTLTTTNLVPESEDESDLELSTESGEPDGLQPVIDDHLLDDAPQPSLQPPVSVVEVDGDHAVNKAVPGGAANPESLPSPVAASPQQDTGAGASPLSRGAIYEITSSLSSLLPPSLCGYTTISKQQGDGRSSHTHAIDNTSATTSAAASTTTATAAAAADAATSRGIEWSRFHDPSPPPPSELAGTTKEVMGVPYNKEAEPFARIRVPQRRVSRPVDWTQELTFEAIQELRSMVMSLAHGEEADRADAEETAAQAEANGEPTPLTSHPLDPRMLLLTYFQVEVLFVLCSLLSGKHKQRVQEKLAAFGLVPRLCALFDCLHWGSLPPRTAGEYGVHGPNCDCNPETALKTQFLRLIQNLCDTPYTHHLKRLLMAPHELKELVNLGAELGIDAELTAKLPPIHTRCAGPRGLLVKLVDALLVEPQASGFSALLASSIECYLRGGAIIDRVYVARRGVLDWCISQLLPLEHKRLQLQRQQQRWQQQQQQQHEGESCATKTVPPDQGRMQSAFDLLAELCKFCAPVVCALDDALSDEAFAKLVQLTTRNLVASNVFLRVILLSTEMFARRGLYGMNVSTSGDDIACVDSVDTSVADVATGSSSHSRGSGRVCKLRGFVADLGNRMNLLRDLLRAISVDEVNQENICCLNTTLMLLYHLQGTGHLAVALKRLQKSSSGGGGGSNNESFLLLRLRDLLRFWRVYYGAHDKDRNLLEQSSRIKMPKWQALVEKLLIEGPAGSSDPEAIAHWLP